MWGCEIRRKGKREREREEGDRERWVEFEGEVWGKRGRTEGGGEGER